MLAAWPDDAKAPDAMLNIATAQDAMGDRRGAQKTLEGLLAKYPAEPAAASAKAAPYAYPRGAKSKSGRPTFGRARFGHDARLGPARRLRLLCLSVDYGQRHAVELESARRLAQALGAAGHRVQRLDLAQIGGSALTDDSIAVPTGGIQPGIPVTYVPARNTILLSLALGWAEVLGAQHIFVRRQCGRLLRLSRLPARVHGGIRALANLATKAAVEGRRIEVRGPLVDLSKAAIIRLALELGVDPAMTVSCYQPDAEGRACGVCDACRIRQAGFVAADLADSTRYIGR